MWICPLLPRAAVGICVRMSGRLLTDGACDSSVLLSTTSVPEARSVGADATATPPIFLIAATSSVTDVPAVPRSTLIDAVPAGALAVTVYEPTPSALNVKRPCASVVVCCVRLLPVRVTAALSTGAPFEVTVPLRLVDAWASTARAVQQKRARRTANAVTRRTASYRCDMRERSFVRNADESESGADAIGARFDGADRRPTIRPARRSARLEREDRRRSASGAEPDGARGVACERGRAELEARNGRAGRLERDQRRGEREERVLRGREGERAGEQRQQPRQHGDGQMRGIDADAFGGQRRRRDERLHRTAGEREPRAGGESAPQLRCAQPALGDLASPQRREGRREGRAGDQ